jgi:hypothetical protein
MKSEEKLFILGDDGLKKTWKTKRLWLLSKDLEVFDFKVDTFEAIDEDCWFGDKHKPTVRNVIRHAKKIVDADLSYPIILNESGIIMDGIHRVCKAHMDGLKTVKAVRFVKDPIPDFEEEYKQ